MVKQVCKASSMYIGVAPVGVLAGAFCTSSRFHSAPAGVYSDVLGRIRMGILTRSVTTPTVRNNVRLCISGLVISYVSLKDL
eukprot:5789277-Pyramimonas_sp.AAC.1